RHEPRLLPAGAGRQRASRRDLAAHLVGHPDAADRARQARGEAPRQAPPGVTTRAYARTGPEPGSEMIDLWLEMHAQTQHNAAGVASGHIDVALTPYGREQAQTILRQRYAGERYDAAY